MNTFISYLFITILAVDFGITQGPSICPGDYTQVGEGCYYFSELYSETSSAWDVASQRCFEKAAANAARLFIAHTNGELLEVTDYMTAAGLSMNAWIGAEDRDGSGTFIWEDDSIFPINSVFWAPNEPSNVSETVTALGQSFEATLQNPTYRWRIYSAPYSDSIGHNFVCEIAD